jgi:hypothetical protein
MYKTIVKQKIKTINLEQKKKLTELCLFFYFGKYTGKMFLFFSFIWIFNL